MAPGLSPVAAGAFVRAQTVWGRNIDQDGHALQVAKVGWCGLAEEPSLSRASAPRAALGVGTLHAACSVQKPSPQAASRARVPG